MTDQHRRLTLKMNKNKAIKIYKLILLEMNNWSEDQINELSLEEITCDPFFEKIKSIMDLNNLTEEDLQ